MSNILIKASSAMSSPDPKSVRIGDGEMDQRIIDLDKKTQCHDRRLEECETLLASMDVRLERIESCVQRRDEKINHLEQLIQRGLLDVQQVARIDVENRPCSSKNIEVKRNVSSNLNLMYERDDDIGLTDISQQMSSESCKYF